jgi:type I restriction enzyme S subunit
LWQTVQVCEAGDVLLGRQRAPQYLTGRWTRSYLRVANIKDDTIDFHDVETMDFDEVHFAKYRLAPGDILVSEGQSPELLGQSAIFRGHHAPLCFQKTLHRFRANPTVTTPEFAQIVFRSHVRSGVFRRLGSITTNIGHLTLEKFKAAPFPLPPLDEQHRIVAEVDRRLSIVREVEAEVDANLKRAQALRQAVLQRAFAIEHASETMAVA